MPESISELHVQSDSPKQTLHLGQVIGGATEPDNVITLSGNLGAGKTWLAKGIAYGLGVPDYEYVNSPAYDLVHQYKGRLTVYHMDLYRLDNLSTDDLLMIQEFYENGGICLIEWPSRLEKYPEAYPAHHLAIHIESSSPDDENQRSVRLSAHDQQHIKLLTRIARNLEP